MATAQPTLDTRDVALADAPSSSAVAGRTAALGIGRLLLGFVFLWSFLDTTFGLYPTPPAESWIAGESPTSGYLASLEGWFAPVFHAIAGQAWVDWAFMFGMGAVGVALTLGVAMRLAAVGAVGLMGALWLTSLPLEHNPIVDEHLAYAAFAVVLAVTGAGSAVGAGRMWSSLPFVRDHRWLT